MESELFGHKRGAFTGADTDRIGLFEAANHGTLLLDEIGELSSAMQVKLLRVLQEREVRRVGENQSRPFDVRVLAATNRSLTDDIEDGSFRQDLFYRLRVVELKVPPLRERPEDILPLARILLANAAIRMSREVKSLSPAVADQFPLNEAEREYIESVLKLNDGNRIKTAEQLEIGSSTLYRKLKSYDAERESSG